MVLEIEPKLAVNKCHTLCTIGLTLLNLFLLIFFLAEGAFSLSTLMKKIFECKAVTFPQPSCTVIKKVVNKGFRYSVF